MDELANGVTLEGAVPEEAVPGDLTTAQAVQMAVSTQEQKGEGGESKADVATGLSSPSTAAPPAEAADPAEALTADTKAPEGLPEGGAAAEPGVEAPAGPSAEAVAAEKLAVAYKGMPGVVADLIAGATVEEVAASYEAAKKAYAAVRAQVLQEQGLAVPAAHSGQGATNGMELPPDAKPIDMIAAGLAQVRPRR